MKLQEAPLNELTFYLDYDGSLCPHLEVWEERIYDPQVILDLMKNLSKKCKGVFWNTGRRPESLASVHRDFMKHSGFFMQGAGFWDQEKGQLEELGPRVSDTWAKLYQEIIQEWPELRLEIKSCSLRVAAFQKTGRAKLEAFVQQEWQRELPGWHWHLGSRGAELLAEGVNKGSALSAMAKKVGGVPVALGDDVLDQPALEEAIRLGGYGIVVGEHCGWATEIDHKASQLIFCENVDTALQFFDSLLKRSRAFSH